MSNARREGRRKADELVQKIVAIKGHWFKENVDKKVSNMKINANHNC